MKTWNMNEKNDLTLLYGQIQMNKDLEALRVSIDAALQVIKGELEDESKGVDYFGIIFSNTPLSMKIQEISRVIMSIDGVQGLEYKSGTFDKRTNALKFQFMIKSVFGDFEYDKLFELPV